MSGPFAGFLPQVNLRIRDDLLVTPPASPGDGYLIEDPVTGKFHRLGRNEFSIAVQLDGSVTIAEAAALATAQNPKLKLSAESQESLSAWLLQSGLVDALVGGSRQPTSLKPSPDSTQSIFMWRFSLGNPERLLTWLTPWLGWIFTRPAFVVAVLAMLAALVKVGYEWQAFSNSFHRVLHPDQHVWLLGCWLLLKVAHELGHGVSCYRFGGEVRNWGICLMFFAPVPYVDVTSTWRFRSRWQRIATAAAGMYAEWLVAAAAVALWCCTTHPAVRQACVYMAGLASVTTVLFNANPLMRFDGYFILSDLLNWPNLSAQAGQYAQAWGNRLLFGAPLPNTSLSRSQVAFLSLFGIASYVWRQVLMLSMLVVTIVCYEAIGVALVSLGIFSWYLRPLLKSKPAAAGKTAPARSWRVFYARSALLAGVALVLAFVPWLGRVSAPGVMQPLDLVVVRTRGGGFVRELHVADGQQVEADQVLAVLRNDALQVELEALEQDERLALVKIQSLRKRRQLVDLQAEESKLQGVQQQLAAQREKIAGLTLRAPVAGRVTARRLADLPGAFLKAGGELCAIAAGGQELVVAIADQQVTSFRAQLGQTVQVRLPGAWVEGRLQSIEPRALRKAHDEALMATYGGPLVVVKRAADADQKKDDTQSDWELLEPHFVGHVQLPSPPGFALGIGQRGTASFRPWDTNLAQYLGRMFDRWIATLREHGS